MKRNRHRICGLLALLLAVGSLSGCGCGPLGLRWCHGGYYRGR